MSDLLNVRRFLAESLMIEGIHRAPTNAERSATIRFLDGELTLQAALDLQAVYAPGKPLRDRIGMDVYVGRSTPPSGSSGMPARLEEVLDLRDPWKAHVAFEKLHPFMDGNGRTGRTVWAWLMLRGGHDPFALPFLHRFYYQTLAAMSDE